MTKKTLMRQLSSDVAGVCACRKMRQASRKITRMYDEVLRPAGIKATQFNVLAIVALGDEATLTELAETLGKAARMARSHSILLTRVGREAPEPQCVQRRNL